MIHKLNQLGIILLYVFHDMQGEENVLPRNTHMEVSVITAAHTHSWSSSYQ